MSYQGNDFEIRGNLQTLSTLNNVNIRVDYQSNDKLDFV
jgi:hypothetical protein